MNSSIPLHWLFAGLTALTLNCATAAPATDTLPGASPLITITDCVKAVRDEATGIVSFPRVLDGEKSDAPAVRVRFRTNSPTVSVQLRYPARSVRNSVGLYRVDGKDTPDWTFKREDMGYPAPASTQTVELPVPAANGPTHAFHDYELILPYGDTVELAGAKVAAGALWEEPAPRPARRWLAFGDSVTQGIGATHVGHTYAFLVAEARGWQVINAGFGGRGAVATDGDYLAGIEADIVTVAIGVNNWQGGTDLPNFRNQITGLITRLRKARPAIPIHVITPLWVAPSWQPEKAKYPLADYRETIRQVVTGLEDANIHLIDGDALIDHDPALFDRIAVHPNDQGYAQMAERLAAALVD